MFLVLLGGSCVEARSATCSLLGLHRTSQSLPGSGVRFTDSMMTPKLELEPAPGIPWGPPCCHQGNRDGLDWLLLSEIALP